MYISDYEYRELTRKIDDLEYELEEKIRKINNLADENERLKDDKSHLSVRIANELEPRLKSERQAYDAWVTTDHSAEVCDSFEYFVDELIETVEDSPEEYFEWDNKNGDVYQKILALILEEIKKKRKEKL